MSNPVLVSVLGATGSVGASALDVIANQSPGAPAFEVVALSANTNVAGLAAAAKASRAEIAVIADDSLYGALKDLLAGTGVVAAAGGLVQVAGGQGGVDVGAVVLQERARA